MVALRYSLYDHNLKNTAKFLVALRNSFCIKRKHPSICTYALFHSIVAHISSMTSKPS